MSKVTSLFVKDLWGIATHRNLVFYQCVYQCVFINVFKVSSAAAVSAAIYLSKRDRLLHLV